ncbi:flagellar basal body-associated FliL family protein [Pantoea sp.]|uniref:flagellar basal body-associated FliL family protein n=1 Tax=Pantoea sp. TaxID=69393 RepID=UPI0031CFEEDC
MKKNNLALSLAMVVGSSVLSAVLVLAGTQLLNSSHNDSESSSGFSLFEKKEKVAEVHYLELKNQVITLKGSGAKERYLLLDLAYVTNSAEEMKAAEHNLPKLKSTLVSIFSGMEYDTARKMSTEDIRVQMMARYEGVFGNNQPFTDVMISKMVFQ